MTKEQKMLLVANEYNQIGFVPSNYVRKETFVDKAKGTFKGFGKNKKSTDFISPTTPDDESNFINGSRSSDNSFNSISAMTAGGVSAVAKFPYEPQRDDELRLNKGDIVKIVEKSPDGWWKGEIYGQTGWFPSNYVEETSNGFDNSFNARPLPGLADMGKPPSAFSNNHSALEVVIALYSFEAQNAEELSFSKGERLEVIEHPIHDPEWWKAKNAKGQVGLIPTNYIEVVNDKPPAVIESNGLPKLKTQVSTSSTGSPYDGQPWYYGRLTREQSDHELNARGVEGDFLVRDSESNPGDYSISLKGNIRNKHFWVQVDKINGSFKIGNRTFQSMDQLIQHYTKSPIFTSDSTNERLYLVKALPR
uniref:Uncharacterized protein n=1 Tax=Acrobeloides nanus TaxID=290746 RepID=A0A914DN58_9BILA